jgi:hypothetical protein
VTIWVEERPGGDPCLVRYIPPDAAYMRRLCAQQSSNRSFLGKRVVLVPGVEYCAYISDALKIKVSIFSATVPPVLRCRWSIEYFACCISSEILWYPSPQLSVERYNRSEGNV